MLRRREDRAAGLVMTEIFPDQQLAKGSASPRAQKRNRTQTAFLALGRMHVTA